MCKICIVHYTIYCIYKLRENTLQFWKEIFKKTIWITNILFLYFKFTALKVLVYFVLNKIQVKFFPSLSKHEIKSFVLLYQTFLGVYSEFLPFELTEFFNNVCKLKTHIKNPTVLNLRITDYRFSYKLIDLETFFLFYEYWLTRLSTFLILPLHSYDWDLLLHKLFILQQRYTITTILRPLITLQYRTKIENRVFPYPVQRIEHQM